jgi:Na+-transporting NADH:ubiquinone oxidoreductase subunit NqrD
MVLISFLRELIGSVPASYLGHPGAGKSAERRLSSIWTACSLLALSVFFIIRLLTWVLRALNLAQIERNNS